MSDPILPGVCHAYGCDNATDEHLCDRCTDRVIAALDAEADAWYAAHHMDGAA